MKVDAIVQTPKKLISDARSLAKIALNTARNIFASPVVILLYHRVTSLPQDPQLLAVSQERFEQHIQHLKEHYNPMRLTELAQRIESGDIPQNTVVVTFDDGYADNLTEAKPIFDKYAVPATIFVTSGMIDSSREFWWDELERLLLLGEAPEVLELDISHQHYSWNTSSQSERYKTYVLLHRLMRPMRHSEREEILFRIAEWKGAPIEGRFTHRAMTTEQLHVLRESTNIDIGAHTQTHPVLSTLSRQEQFDEIWKSRIKLEQVLEQNITAFAYPFGSKLDYNRDTIQVCKEIGFGIVCANFPDQVRKGTDKFQIPRWLIRNWDISLFSKKLKEFYYK